MVLAILLVLVCAAVPSTSSPGSSFAPTSSLSSPAASIPNEPELQDGTEATGSTNVPLAVPRGNQSFGTYDGCTSIPSWFDAAPLWWLSGAATLWRLLPFLAAAFGALICCCCLIRLLKRCICGQQDTFSGRSRAYHNEHHYRNDHHHHHHPPSRNHARSRPDEGHYRHQPPSMPPSRSHALGLGRGFLWSDRSRRQYFDRNEHSPHDRHATSDAPRCHV
jgi:hypothetical protein